MTRTVLHRVYCPKRLPPPPDSGGSSWLCCCDFDERVEKAKKPCGQAVVAAGVSVRCWLEDGHDSHHQAPRAPGETFTWNRNYYGPPNARVAREDRAAEVRLRGEERVAELEKEANR